MLLAFDVKSTVIPDVSLPDRELLDFLEELISLEANGIFSLILRVLFFFLISFLCLGNNLGFLSCCLLYTSPSPRD